MAFGDDFTDEDTFKALPEKSFTIKVGTSASEAKFSVNSYREALKLLRKITKLGLSSLLAILVAAFSRPTWL